MLWDLSGDTPTQIADVEQEGQRPFFTGSPAGERMTASAGLIARSYFAADSSRRCIWVTREGQPTAIPMPSDW